MKSASETLFDEAYYQRFYFDKKTSVADPQHLERLGAFVCSYLQYLRVPVRRVLWSSAPTCASALAGSAVRSWTTAPAHRLTW